MKILHLIFSLSSGGAERYVVDLCNELSDSDDIYLCVIEKELNGSSKKSFYRHELLDNIKYINLGSSRGLSVQAFFSVIQLIYQLKPEVVHAHLNVILYLYIPSLIFRNKVRFYHTLHNVANKTIGFRWQKKLNRVFYGSLIQPVTISSESRKSYNDFYRLSNSVQINNGRKEILRSEEFENVKAEIENYKTNSDDTVFIHIARCNEEQKRQSILIRVFNELLKNKRHVILLVIGSGYSDKENLKLTEGNLPGIYFLGTRHNVGDYLFNSDVFCLTSLYEGLPISLIEAYATGVFPICTPAGGVTNLIINDNLGYITKGFSELEYFETICRFLERRKPVSREILREHFLKNYSISQSAKKHLVLYKKEFSAQRKMKTIQLAKLS